jgi:nitrogen regulatory protein PII
MSEIIYLTDLSVITCIIDKEQSDTALRAARELGARAAIVHSAQSWGVRERLGTWGVAVETEKDVIMFLVSSDQQDLIFDAIYKAAHLDEPGRGFMFVSTVDRGATYLPEAVRQHLGVNVE